MKKKQLFATILLAMRITIVQITLVLIFTCSLYANKTSGQEILDRKISLSVQNLELDKVLLKVQNLTDVKFLYSPNTILAERKISFSVADKKLRTFINEILGPLSIDYKVVEDQILLYPVRSNTQANMDSSYLENIKGMQIAGFFLNDNTVKGTVTDNNGTPLAGATVMVKSNKRIVTVTDNSGEFILDISAPAAVLVISYTGFKPQEISVTANQVVSVKLAIVENSLNEVIVTGYSKQSKRDVTGAVSTVSADIISHTPVTDVGTALEGRVAGVSVDQQGDPGSTAKVRIRGFGTNGDNDPLYVIDGVQMVGGNNLLNPNDIESITILKDPSITSLYGARGGNGVIVITTKSGKMGAPRLEYSSYASWESPIKYPGMLTPQQYADAYWGYLKNSGLAQTDSYYGNGATPVLPDYIIERQNGSQLAVPEGGPAANPALYNLSSYRILKTNKQGTDWFRAVLGQAFSQNHQLNLSGATDKSNYALTFNYFNNKGILLGTFFKRYSLRVNTEFKPSKWLKVGENAEFSYSEGSSVGNHNPQGFFADLYQRSPLIPIYDIAGNYSGPKGITNSLAFHPGGNNPVFGQINNSERSANGYNAGIIGSAYADVEPIKGLVFETKIGVQFYSNSYHFFSDTIPQNVFSAPYNSLTEGSGWSSDWRWTNKISYDVRIHQVHKISAFVAYESNHSVYRNSSASTPNLPYTIPSYQYLSNGAPVDTTGGIFNAVSGGGDAGSNLSTFGNINYSLLDKYLLSFVYRHDGSSVFGPQDRYGDFFSYSGGWRISDEKFMKGLKFINDFKIRAARGENGNNAIPSGLFENQYNTNTYVSSYDLNGSNNSALIGVGLYQLGNPFIHWEKNITTNVGFDATLFKNRLTASFSWFDRQTKDLLAVVPISGLQGDALAPYVNIMRFSNKGYELELGYHDRLGNVKYDMDFNISTYRNKVMFIAGDSTDHLDGDSYNPTHFSLTRSVVGRPVSSFYGLVQLGIFQSGDEYTKYGVTEPGLTADNAAGHFKFADINNDGKIDDNDRTFIGSPHPKFSYGYNLNVSYKNLDISVFVQGVAGNKIFNYWRQFSVWPGALGKGSEDTWSTTNTSAKLPIWSSTTSDDLNPSSFFVEDGSYVRIKSLQLGYTFPKNKAFSRLRVYVQGYNLATFTKYSGIDPEISNGSPTNYGIDLGGNYPIPQKILVGLNFGL
ncbi:MAG: TonB-dependent receptor [Ginsengibacter sp.]